MLNFFLRISNLRNRVHHILSLVLLVVVVPHSFAQRIPSFTLLTDTVVLDIKSYYSPLSQLVLQDATMHHGLLYCRFLEKSEGGFGLNDQYFYIINPITGQAQREKCQYHYDYNGFFVLTDTNVVFYNVDDSVMATPSPKGWNYCRYDGKTNMYHRDLKPITIFHDSTYLVDFLGLGEWGDFTWICHLPSNKHLLYPMALLSPVHIGDTLYMRNSAGIFCLYPELISLAQKAFCTANKCRNKEEWWFLNQFYPKTYKKNLSKRLRRFAKKNFSDTIDHTFPIAMYSYWPWEKQGDTTIHRLFDLHGQLAAVVNIRDQVQVSIVEGRSLTPLCCFDIHKNLINNNIYHADNSFTIRFDDDRFLSNILHIKGDTLRLITIVQDQDTLPWRPTSSFDTMLSLIHHHTDSITPEFIHRHETDHGSASSRMQWMKFENGDLFRPYNQLLTNNLKTDVFYYFSPDSILSTVIWDFACFHCDVDYLDPSSYAIIEHFFVQVQSKIIEQLGPPSLVDDDDQKWYFPEGNYSFMRKNGRCRLCFNAGSPKD